MTPATLPARSVTAIERAWNPDEEGSAYRRVTPNAAPGADEFDRTNESRKLNLASVGLTNTERRVPAPSAPGRTPTDMPL